MRDLIGRDEKTRGRGERKVSTTNFKGGYVKTRCLRNQRFLSSDAYCVKATNEEKKEKYHGAFYRIVGFAGKRFLFPPPPTPSFLFSWLLSLSPTFGQKLDRNVLLACILYSRRLLRSLFGPLHVSGKLPTYPCPKPTSTLTSHLGQKCWLRGGVGRNI